MTVKELIEQLQMEDPKRIVVMSKDSEGNNFSPLADLSLDKYVAENDWHGTIVPEKLTAKLRKQGYTEEDVKKGEKALVLWPTN